MTVTIRKLNDKEHDYLAYAKSLCGHGTYFLYFTDDIWGAVLLHTFIEMLRSFFKPERVEVAVAEKDLTLKNNALLQLLKD